MNKKQALALIANPDTTQEQLLELVDHKDVFVRRALASCEHQEVVERFIHDDDWSVRGRVAANPNASGRAIDVLQSEPLESIRIALASNPNPFFAGYLHFVLIRDPHPRVRASVAANPSIQAQNVYPLSVDDSTEVRVSLAANSVTPPDILATLATDYEFDVRRAVRFNTNTSDVTRHMLAQEFN